MKHNPDIGLGDVLTSAAGALGAPNFIDSIGISDSSVVVVCLVDGLGAVAIEEHEQLFPTLMKARGGSIEAAFPTTTSTGLVSLGTGLNPGMHGVVGASFWLPETGEVLAPLRWGSTPSPFAVQPEPTVFERIQDVGVTCFSVGPKSYIHSGLTRAAFRGSEYLSAESVDDRSSLVADIADRSSGKGPSLIYVYWPALDRTGHEFGVDSRCWREAAADVDALIAKLHRALPPGGRLVVTADHGMIDTKSRVWIEDDHRLSIDVRAIAGEPRMRHLYTDVPEDVAQRWSSVLGDTAQILTRESAIRVGLFGEVDDVVAERIGDVVALPDDGILLASHTYDELVSSLPGQHGGRTEAERRIPALILD
jgi:predicted AlkP superfamily pyrophosphatase or phosphodiesterase